MGYAFVPPHNPGNYPPKMGTAREQALRTKRFQQKHALLRRYTAMEGYQKKQIITMVQPVFLFPLVDQLTGFGQISALDMLQHLFNYYEAINEIGLK